MAPSPLRAVGSYPPACKPYGLEAEPEAPPSPSGRAFRMSLQDKSHAGERGFRFFSRQGRDQNDKYIWIITRETTGFTIGSASLGAGRSGMTPLLELRNVECGLRNGEPKTRSFSRQRRGACQQV